ncbi:hypothetical protein SNEBB_007213 [Seison nebaliae]|nr:hypothetical protein SNEBB_007213 [Seison nebaliae]
MDVCLYDNLPTSGQIVRQHNYNHLPSILISLIHTFAQQKKIVYFYIILIHLTLILSTVASPKNNLFIIRSNSKDKKGTFHSPNFPYNYPSTTILNTYRFIGLPNEKVRIVFERFKLHGFPPGCNNDFIDVYINSTENNDVNELQLPLLQHCGDIPLKPIVSLNNIVEIVFHSEHGYSSKGFNASYEFFDAGDYRNGRKKYTALDRGIKKRQDEFQRPSDTCFYYFTSEDREGKFYSPTYPGLYPKHMLCDYKFVGRNGERVQIEFENFELFMEENEQHCPYDSVVLYDGDNIGESQIARLCGKHKKLIYFSSNETLYLRFRTEDSTLLAQYPVPNLIANRVGFIANFKFRRDLIQMKDINRQLVYKDNSKHLNPIISPSRDFFPKYFMPLNKRLRRRISAIHIRGSECDIAILSDASERENYLKICNAKFEKKTSETIESFSIPPNPRHKPEEDPLICRMYLLGQTAYPAYEAAKIRFSQMTMPSKKTNCSDGHIQLYMRGQEITGTAPMTDLLAAIAYGTDQHVKEANIRKTSSDEKTNEKKVRPDNIVCGSRQSSWYKASAPLLSLVYNTTSRDHSFTMDFTFFVDYDIPGKQKNDECKFIYDINRHSGSFNSPWHPRNYPPVVDCSYIFHIPHAQQLQLEWRYRSHGWRRHARAALFRDAYNQIKNPNLYSTRLRIWFTYFRLDSMSDNKCLFDKVTMTFFHQKSSKKKILRQFRYREHQNKCVQQRIVDEWRKLSLEGNGNHRNQTMLMKKASENFIKIKDYFYDHEPLGGFRQDGRTIRSYSCGDMTPAPIVTPPDTYKVEIRFQANHWQPFFPLPTTSGFTGQYQYIVASNHAFHQENFPEYVVVPVQTSQTLPPYVNSVNSKKEDVNDKSNRSVVNVKIRRRVKVSGAVISPRYPHKYKASQTLESHLRAPESEQRFLLSFADFNVESDQNKRSCSIAVLRITQYFRNERREIEESLGTDSTINNSSSVQFIDSIRQPISTSDVALFTNRYREYCNGVTNQETFVTDSDNLIFEFLTAPIIMGGTGFRINWTLLEPRLENRTCLQCVSSVLGIVDEIELYRLLKTDNVYCIHHDILCDGIKHCDDGSDEEKCENNLSYSTTYLIVALTLISIILLISFIILLIYRCCPLAFMHQCTRWRKRSKMKLRHLPSDYEQNDKLIMNDVQICEKHEMNNNERKINKQHCHHQQKQQCNHHLHQHYGAQYERNNPNLHSLHMLEKKDEKFSDNNNNNNTSQNRIISSKISSCGECELLRSVYRQTEQQHSEELSKEKSSSINSSIIDEKQQTTNSSNDVDETLSFIQCEKCFNEQQTMQMNWKKDNHEHRHRYPHRNQHGRYYHDRKRTSFFQFLINICCCCMPWLREGNTFSTNGIMQNGYRTSHHQRHVVTPSYGETITNDNYHESICSTCSQCSIGSNTSVDLIRPTSSNYKQRNSRQIKQSYPDKRQYEKLMKRNYRKTEDKKSNKITNYDKSTSSIKRSSNKHSKKYRHSVDEYLKFSENYRSSKFQCQPQTKDGKKNRKGMKKEMSLKNLNKKKRRKKRREENIYERKYSEDYENSIISRCSDPLSYSRSSDSTRSEYSTVSSTSTTYYIPTFTEKDTRKNYVYLPSSLDHNKHNLRKTSSSAPLHHRMTKHKRSRQKKHHRHRRKGDETKHYSTNEIKIYPGDDMRSFSLQSTKSKNKKIRETQPEGLTLSNLNVNHQIPKSGGKPSTNLPISSLRPQSDRYEQNQISYLQNVNYKKKQPLKPILKSSTLKSERFESPMIDRFSTFIPIDHMTNSSDKPFSSQQYNPYDSDKRYPMKDIDYQLHNDLDNPSEISMVVNLPEHSSPKLRNSNFSEIRNEISINETSTPITTTTSPIILTTTTSKNSLSKLKNPLPMPPLSLSMNSSIPSTKTTTPPSLQSTTFTKDAHWENRHYNTHILSAADDTTGSTNHRHTPSSDLNVFYSPLYETNRSVKSVHSSNSTNSNQSIDRKKTNSNNSLTDSSSTAV